MELNFWDFEAWSTLLLFAVLLGSLLVGNVLKKGIPFLQKSLIPTSVLGGLVIIIVAAVYKAITGEIMLDADIFGGDGMAKLEVITYHTLALGFIASSFKTTKGKMNKKRVEEIFNTGVTTVSTYLIQAVSGLVVTILAALVISGFFSASGVLVALGYGQGTGQALNFGKQFEAMGFDSGGSFGLTIAALGFLSASIGGVIHMNVMKRMGKLKIKGDKDALNREVVEEEGEIPMQESMDKMTVQIALIAMAYMLTFAIMSLLGKLLPGMKATIFGFNFLLGVLCTVLIKGLLNFLKKKKIIKKEHTNNFLMTRASNFFFDIMVVAGIAAIRLDALEKYWGVMLILGVVGLLVTYIYNRIVAKVLFKDYTEEQFLAMYGMLTGTASTGIILLREVDGDFESPASDNLVYQNFPAIVFGFPILLIVPKVPENPPLYLAIFAVFFVVMNIILFRKQILHLLKGKKSKKASSEQDAE